ncbi:MAG: hypothetical protein Q9163_003865 [Psora crenata]
MATPGGSAICDLIAPKFPKNGINLSRTPVGLGIAAGGNAFFGEVISARSLPPMALRVPDISHRISRTRQLERASPALQHGLYPSSGPHGEILGTHRRLQVVSVPPIGFINRIVFCPPGTHPIAAQGSRA